ncbi:hypothetical protein HQ529_06435, partial [Candidatus Woesearchaeota archaeon]|nr:hypothetical protein [Candidatus Woesearchaeota archaeon]
MKKMLSGLILFLVSLIVVTSLAAAVPVTIEKVKLNNDEISESATNEIRGVERGEEFEVKVEVRATADVTDAEISVEITGVHNEDIEDTTDTFDMRANVTYVKKLYLTLPGRMDVENYRLRVRVDNKAGDTTQEDYTLEVATPSNLIQIRDVLFSPSYEVKAGRSLLSTVRLKNYGAKNEDGVKVTVSIPDLGISASDYIDELEAGDSVTSEELYMRIPASTETGDYSIKIEVLYDDGDEKETAYETLTIVGEEGSMPLPNQPAGETTVTVPESRDVETGGSAAYPVTITNAGSTSTTYTLSVSGLDAWGSFSLDPGNVLVVPAGGTTSAFLTVHANDDAVAGVYNFAVGVSTNEGTQTVSLEANVGGEAAGSSFKRALELGVIVLVIILVILGLIIGFNKLRGGEEGEKPGE